MKSLTVIAALLLLWAAYPSPIDIPPDPQPVPRPVATAAPRPNCQCGSKCDCAPCSKEEYNALLQERIDLALRIQELEKQNASIPKPVCDSAGCRVAAAPVARSVPVAYYQKRPVYGRFGRLLYYENVLVRSSRVTYSNCATGGCR